MKKIVLKDCIRRIEIVDQENSNGPAIYLNHWDFSPFGSGALTPIPFDLEEATRVRDYFVAWVEKEEKRRKRQREKVMGGR